MSLDVLPATVPAAPFLVPLDHISGGDTAWMLVSCALVLMMTVPGLALFYAGMVRKKNVLSTAMHSLMVCCIASVLWFAIGYSLAFTPGSTPYLGGLSRIFLDGVSYQKLANLVSVSHMAPNIPESVFVMFQMTFAIITPALITGAFAERMRFSAMVLFVSLWLLLVYAPVAHWVWEPSGWLASMGMLDFAGGTVVHINAGAAGLMCAYALGPRMGYGRQPFFPFNLALTMAGTGLLWVGWFGFHAGSALSADGRAGMAMLATQIAAATAALSWCLAEWVIKGRPTMLGACSGVVAGLVAVTPASGFVDPVGAAVIGASAGALCLWSATGLKRLLGADDALDVFGVHGIGGLIGALLTGVLARPELSGVMSHWPAQITGALATLAYSAVVTLVILKVIDALVGLRVATDDEQAGLDVSQHGEQIQ